MLRFLSRFGVIQNYIDVRTLTKAKEAHGCWSVELSPGPTAKRPPPFPDSLPVGAVTTVEQGGLSPARARSRVAQSGGTSPRFA
ncbi:hypothetical protein EYF80_013106 [Liparis tanakae]|uniref:Uncharacterized protein n=1 Tax=Liparis tanakae TaxID=230148 RepID=A0A4Z2IGT4_9TELE|nr:hypothetical protein EYF80_013106 [Liparis tanakae]